jgi:hypothetical protein
LYLFFLCENLFSRISKNGKRADEWDPPVSHCVTWCRALIGCPGQHCHRARVIKALTVLTTRHKTLAAPPLLRPGELTTPPLFLRPLLLSHLSFLHRSPFVASLSPSPEPLLRLPPSLSQHRRCLSSCIMYAALPRARVHAEAPLSGAPSLLSAAALSAAVRHRCACPRAAPGTVQASRVGVVPLGCERNSAHWP